MIKFKTPYNAHEFEKRYETNPFPSMTVPDQTMSIREIMQRFAKGLPIDGSKVPIYDEENDLPDLRTLDLAEREDYINSYTAELNEIKQKQEKKKPNRNPKVLETPPTEAEVISEDQSGPLP